MVPALSDKVSRVSSYSGSCLSLALPCTWLSHPLAGLSRTVPLLASSRFCSPNPKEVWALPRSLAATYGITFVFSSSGYLDVSVHRVPSINLWIQLMVL